MLREFIKQKYIAVANLIKPNSKVLDIGCNKALIKDFLPDNVSYQGVEFEGADRNKNLVKELNQKGIKVHYANLDEDNLKLKEKFDYILILDVLEHLVYPERIINAVKSLRKENGQIIISLPNDYHLLNKLRFLFNREIVPSFEIGGHLHVFPIKKGRELLKKNELIITKTIFVPSEKPKFLPNSLKRALANLFPNSFARTIIYVTK